MKLTALAIAASLLLSSTVGVLAADKSVEKHKIVKPAKNKKHKKIKLKHPKHKEVVTVTGSYLKQEVNRNGLVSMGASPIYVLDSQSIQNSGAADLRELLTHKGVNR